MSAAKHRASDPAAGNASTERESEALDTERLNAEAAKKLQQSEAQVKETAHDIERDLK